MECLHCNKRFKKIGRNHKYCSIKCKTEAWHKDNPNKKAMYSQKWNKNNKEKLRKAMKKYYWKNRNKCRERNFVKTHMFKIMLILGMKCKKCSEPMQEIHHEKYDNLPRDNLEEYCKFLTPLCWSCHRKTHR